MTKFIELTIRDTKLTINVNNILQFHSREPDSPGTKIVIVDGAKSKDLYASESYEDILRALEVKRIFDCNDENNARPKKSSTWVL